MIWLKLVSDFLGGIRASIFFVLLLLALAGGKFWQHKAEGYKAERDTIAAAHAVSIALWKGEIDRLTRDLASAKSAGDAAIEAKKAAEVAAVKRLKARDKYWRDKYASDPQAKAWSEQAIPEGVLDGLR